MSKLTWIDPWNEKVIVVNIEKAVSLVFFAKNRFDEGYYLVFVLFNFFEI